MAEQSNLNRLFQTAGTQKAQQGTGYTNLNRLFQANTGSQLGQKVAGGIQKQVSGVQSQLAEQQKQFKEEAEKSKIGGAEDVAKREEVLGRFTSPTAQGGTLSDEDVSAFERFRSGQYAGPQGLKDTAALQNTAAQLKGQVTGFTPGGTQELLRRTVGGGRYTQGQQKLDTLLLDRSALTPIQRQASALGQDIQRANLAASGQAELLKNQAQQFAAETGERLTGGLTDIEKSVQSQLVAAQEAEKQRQQALRNISFTATGTRPKLDEQGNPIIDPSTGKAIMETGPSMSSAERTSGVYKQLSESGVDPSQLNTLFGNGDTVAKLDAAKAIATEKLAQAYGAVHGGVNSWDRYYAEQNIKGVLNNPSARAYYGLGDTYTNLVNASKLGQAYNQGSVDDFLKRISASVQSRSGSTEGAAQDITEQGVASEQQRAQYEALNRLLGRTASDAKYRTEDPTKYRAGRILINPEQI